MDNDSGKFGSNNDSNEEFRPTYMRILLTFARNSLIRAMSFRMNFWLECVSSISWTLMTLGFFKIIFSKATSIGAESGWHENEFFVFLATTWIVNSLIQTFIMPNAQEFSELIRTGDLDFALLKPVDTQFLISFPKMEWSNLTNFFFGTGLLCYSVYQLTQDSANQLVVTPLTVLLYVFFVACGLVILYGVMISLSAVSIWLGRNQTLYTFWFYITNFYRQPMEIYQQGFAGWFLWAGFSFLFPILLVANVPARLMAQPVRPESHWMTTVYCFYAVFAAAASLLFSRFVFKKALASYRSASS